MSVVDGPKTDKEWQAHDDAHSLRRAAEVHGDPERLKAAQKALEQIEKETQAALEAIQRAKELPDKMYPKMEEKKE